MSLFIALFDYDPAVMSPNQDAGDTELAFHKDQILKVTFFITLINIIIIKCALFDI